MTIATTTVRLASAVPVGGSFLAPYPAGHSLASKYATSGHAIVDSSGNRYTLGVVIANAGRSLLVTNLTERALAAGYVVVEANEIDFVRREWAPPRTRVVKRGTNLNRVVTANSGTAATVTAETTTPFGRPAIQVAIPSGNTWAEVGYNDLNLPAFAGHVAFRVWVEDYTLISDLKTFVGNSGYALNSLFTDFVSTSNTSLMNGERVLYVGPTRVNAGGTFVWGQTTLQNTKLRITPVAAATTNVWVEAIEIPEPAPAMVAFTMDDSSVTWMTRLLPLLRRYGIRATFNVNSGAVDTNPALFVTSTNLRQLVAEGHQVTCHNVSNLKYTAPPYSGDQTLTQYMADYTTARKALEGYGLPAEGFMYHSYVQGGFDAALIAEMEGEGVRCARIAALPRIMQYGAGVGRDIMALRTYEMGTNYPMSAVLAGVDDVATYGGLMVIMGHEFIESGTPVGVEALVSEVDEVLRRIADYQIETVTMAQAYERLYLAQSLSRPALAP
jgi:hypothetical protein